MGIKKYVSRDAALAQLQRYCAYQERCHQEVRKKLLDLGIYGEDLDAIIATLIEENFLNEARFAQSFASGKFRIKKWGKVRITQELRFRQISDYCIRKALDQLDPEAYRATLHHLLSGKMNQWQELPLPERRHKTAAYAIRKGFEPELVWEHLRAFINPTT